MKKSSFIIIILAAALAVVTYLWLSQSKRTDSESTALDVIMTRTSVRSYSDAPVGSNTIDTLLRAAMAAPTAGNIQPWRFVVIDSRDILDSIAAKFGNMKMAAQAEAAVIVCGDMEATFPGDGKEYWVQDASAATENLLLAAHACGLGAVWCGIYPIPECVSQFSDMLQLPDNIVPMACVCLGYPDGTNTPKDKWRPENVHYNRW